MKRNDVSFRILVTPRDALLSASSKRSIIVLYSSARADNPSIPDAHVEEPSALLQLIEAPLSAD
jgi:hypothetical protein